MDCEIVLPYGMRSRACLMLRAMLAAAPAAGVHAVPVGACTGRAEVVMTWGYGHVGRRPALLRQLQRGGHVVAWDFGYWQRDSHYRLSIDADHPAVLPTVPNEARFAASSIMLRNDYNAAGPIVLVGMGAKSRKALGYEGTQWERETYATVRQAYPQAAIVYRPKKPEPFGACPQVMGSIENVLRGARLVVCRHSNVAIDACIAGVPVVCSHGAAAMLYGSDVAQPRAVTVAQRLDFLQRLAWWQWRPCEAVQAWAFIRGQLCV